MVSLPRLANRGEGPAKAYHRVFDLMRTLSDLWIEPFEIKVLGLKDSLAKAFLAVIEPDVTESPSSARKARLFPGMSQFGGSTIGGVSFDGAMFTRRCNVRQQREETQRAFAMRMFNSYFRYSIPLLKQRGHPS